MPGPSAISMLFPGLFSAVSGGGPPSPRKPAMPDLSGTSFRGITPQEVSRQYETRPYGRRVGPLSPQQAQDPASNIRVPGTYQQGIPASWRRMFGEVGPARPSPVPSSVSDVPRRTLSPGEIFINRGDSVEPIEPRQYTSEEIAASLAEDQANTIRRARAGEFEVVNEGGKQSPRPQGIHSYRFDNNTDLIQSPVSEVAQEAMLRALIGRDVIRSAGVQPEQFMLEFWTEHFTQNGSDKSLASRQAIEMVDIGYGIYNGGAPIETTSPTGDIAVDAIATRMRTAWDRFGSNKSFDLNDSVKRIITGYGGTDLNTETGRLDAAQRLLKTIDAATVVDFDPAEFLYGEAGENAAIPQYWAQQILKSWSGFGPRDLREGLELAASGSGEVTVGQIRDILQPLQTSQEAFEMRRLALGGEEMFTNAMAAFKDGDFQQLSSSPTHHAMLRALYRDTLLAVKDANNPDPNAVDFYYITRGYQGRNAPEKPIVSKIVFDMGQQQDITAPGTLEIPDDNKPGGVRFVQPFREPRERRVKLTGTELVNYKATVDSWASDPNISVAAITDGHNKLWPIMKSMENIADDAYQFRIELPSAPWTQPPPRTPLPKLVVPQPPLIPRYQGRALGASQMTKRLLGIHQTQATPYDPAITTAILGELTPIDMRNVFGPKATRASIQKYLTKRFEQQPDVASHAGNVSQFISGMRSADTRAWSLGEIDNARALAAELTQKDPTYNPGPFHDEGLMNQEILDNWRRRKLISEVPKFVPSAPSVESELTGKVLVK